jgi:nickel transport protein
MKRINKLVTLAALVASIGAATTAEAHGIWFAQRSTQLALLYGVGADDLDVVKRYPLVSSIAGYDADGKPVPTSLQVDGRLLLVNVENQPAIVSAVLDNGTWSKTPDGKWHKQGKDEQPTAVISEKNTKYAVHIRGALTKPLTALPGQTLQIIPVGGKLPDLLGQPIKVQVLYKGKPVAGAKVMHDWINDPDQKPVLTGADGTVTLAVRNQGLNVLAAIFNSPSEEPAKYEHLEHLATLSFVLPHAPE